MKYTFTLPGNPIPLARARIKSNLFFSKSTKRMWDPQKELKVLTAITLTNQFEELGIKLGSIPFDEPVHLDVVFYMPIAKTSVKKTKSLSGTYHIKRPDLSNMLKFIEDACTGVLYKDDSLIASVTVKKIYDTEPKTVFTIYNI